MLAAGPPIDTIYNNFNYSTLCSLFVGCGNLCFIPDDIFAVLGGPPHWWILPSQSDKTFILLSFISHQLALLRLFCGQWNFSDGRKWEKKAEKLYFCQTLRWGRMGRGVSVGTKSSNQSFKKLICWQKLLFNGMWREIYLKTILPSWSARKISNRHLLINQFPIYWIFERFWLQQKLAGDVKANASKRGTLARQYKLVARIALRQHLGLQLSYCLDLVVHCNALIVFWMEICHLAPFFWAIGAQALRKGK